jgi:ABC transport system ATP-binding/permease protein
MASVKKSNQTTLINAKKLDLSYGGNFVFKNISFNINQSQKLCILGPNRAGKSSLMSIIRGINQDYLGEVVYKNNLQINYINQNQPDDLNITIASYFASRNSKQFKMLDQYKTNPTQELTDSILSFGGFELEQIIDSKLKQFGLFDIKILSPLKNLSGGQLKKIQIIADTLFDCDLLILDEPTNHLDISGITQLTKYLKNLQSACIVISHDRSFVEELEFDILELWEQKLYLHKNGYNSYLEARASRLDNQATIDQKRVQWLKREYQWVSSGVQARATKDKGRMSRFEQAKSTKTAKQLEVVDMIIPEPIHLGNKILDVTNLSITDKKTNNYIIKDLNIKINQYDKIGIIGDNGTGKSTLIKTLIGQNPDYINISSGTIKTGINTKYLYLSQNKNELKFNQTLFDFISEGKESLSFGEKQISTYKYLSNWLFFSDQYHQNISNLSGGEKTKLLLAKGLLQASNFLVLDEPTNDLDTESINLLEQNLIEYPCPVVVISHDRKFLDNICNVIIKLFKDGQTQVFYGNYSDFIECQKDTNNELTKNETAKPPNTKQPKLTPKDNRIISAKIREFETKIISIENKIKDLNLKLNTADCYNSPTKYQKTAQTIKNLEADLVVFEAEWERLTEISI